MNIIARFPGQQQSQFRAMSLGQRPYVNDHIRDYDVMRRKSESNSLSPTLFKAAQSSHGNLILI